MMVTCGFLLWMFGNSNDHILFIFDVINNIVLTDRTYALYEWSFPGQPGFLHPIAPCLLSTFGLS